MDAVQKVGNGHPGTAMSLAPAAYLLFQKVMRHNPADPHWLGPRPVRALLRPLQPDPLHPALPRRLGPRARGPQVAAHLGQQDPGPPGVRPHRRRRDHHRSARARASATPSGMAMAARRERGLLDPERRARATRPFDHHIYALCSDGDIEEGVSAEASAIAGVQQLGNLTLIYDDNQISIEDDTNIALSEDVARALRGLRLARPDTSTGPTTAPTYEEDVPALYDAIRKAEAVTDKPSFIVLHTIIAWPAPDAQNTGKAHGSALGADEVAATKKILGFDPDQTFEVPPGVIEHTRRLRRARRGRRRPRGTSELRRLGARSPPPTPRCFDRLQTAQPARGLGRRPADLPGRREGRRDPRGLRRRSSTRSRRTLPELWGGSADLAESNNTTIEGAPSFLPDRPRHQDVEGRPAGGPGAALRHPRARHGRDHERHRRRTAAPASSAAPSSPSPTTCAARSGSPR